MPPHPPVRSVRRRLVPATARTRIIAWMLLLVLAALGIVTFVTWRLLVSGINTRMDEALRARRASTRAPANRSRRSTR